MVWEEMKNKLVTSNQYHRIVINIKSKYSLKTLNGFNMRSLVFLALAIIIICRERRQTVKLGPL